MQSGQPSRTARAAAAHRAVHQVLEQGRIFSDPLAAKILDVDIDTMVREAQSRPESRRMRIFIAARTRFAEDALAAAHAIGVRQLVVLGAGLDTFAYRNTLEGLRVFEVDHPATQAWKRQRLGDSDISIPATLTFAPVDFERETLSQGLAAVGFDASKPAFFIWLGVVPYLTASAIDATLAFIAGLPQGSQVIFDYANPPESLDAEAREQHASRAAYVAALGERWVSYFAADRLHERLRTLGFVHIEDLGPRQIAARYFPQQAAAAPENGGHIVRTGR